MLDDTPETRQQYLEWGLENAISFGRTSYEDWRIAQASDGRIDPDRGESGNDPAPLVAITLPLKRANDLLACMDHLTGELRDLPAKFRDASTPHLVSVATDLCHEIKAAIDRALHAPNEPILAPGLMVAGAMLGERAALARANGRIEPGSEIATLVAVLELEAERMIDRALDGPPDREGDPRQDDGWLDSEQSREADCLNARGRELG